MSELAPEEMWSYSMDGLLEKRQRENELIEQYRALHKDADFKEARFMVCWQMSLEARERQKKAGNSK
jgi:hypothetical protein